MKYRKLLAYAQDFVSFLTFNLEEKLFKRIERIILFGSAARGEATKKSDVDIFVEVTSSDAEVEKAAERIVEAFFDSPKFTRYWKLMGIENPFSCKFGKAAEWKDIYPSIIQDGIALFEKYHPGAVGGKQVLLFSWENIRPESKRVTINRKLYGYRRRGKEYQGLLSQYAAKRVSKVAALVPLEHRHVFEELFKSHKVTAKVYPLQEAA